MQNRVPKIDNTLRRAGLGAARHDGRGAARASSTPIAARCRAAARCSTSIARRSGGGPGDRSVLLALKIDVDTFRGTREGVPRLVRAAAARTAPARRSCSASVPTTPAARCGACSGPAS